MQLIDFCNVGAPCLTAPMLQQVSRFTILLHVFMADIHERSEGRSRELKVGTGPWGMRGLQVNAGTQGGASTWTVHHPCSSGCMRPRQILTQRKSRPAACCCWVSG